MRSRPVLMMLAAIAWGGAAAACAASDSLDVARCAASLTATLPPQVTETMARIDGEDRQLLALRSYLRSAESLGSKWSWSEERIAGYVRSAEYQAAQAELARINARFEAANPGYTLYVNSQVRSLDRQIRLFNGNPSVLSTAQTLQKAVQAHRSGLVCDSGQDAQKQTLADFLRAWSPPRAAPLAAPGLSKHGQGRAFDFQVKRGNQLIVGTDTRSTKTWDGAGWTQKLREAVSSGSTKFVGPLPAPYEPWHYEYQP